MIRLEGGYYEGEFPGTPSLEMQGLRPVLIGRFLLLPLAIHNTRDRVPVYRLVQDGLFRLVAYVRLQEGFVSTVRRMGASERMGISLKAAF